MHGSTTNVVKPSVSAAVWSALAVRPVGELPVKSIQVRLVGVTQLRVNGRLRDSFGGRSTCYLAAGSRLLVLISASMNSASFFHDKVDAVRQNTEGAPEPTFSTARSRTSLVSFTPVSVDDVVSAISRLLQIRSLSR